MRRSLAEAWDGLGEEHPLVPLFEVELARIQLARGDDELALALLAECAGGYADGRRSEERMSAEDLARIRAGWPK